MEPISRTLSSESVRSSSSGHILSSAASSSSNRKGRHVDIDATVTQTDPASISMPASGTKQSLRYHTLSRCSSNHSESAVSTTASYTDNHTLLTSNPRAMSEPEDIEATLEAIKKGSILDSGIPSATRRSEPDLDSRRMSFSSLYGGGRGAVASGPSSVAGGSDQDGAYLLRNRGELAGVDAATARPELGDRTTTATQNLSVTSSSQNGALSPSLNNSWRDTQPSSLSNRSDSPANSATSSAPPQSRQGRTVRGRPIATSRRISTSNPNSSTHSTDRATIGGNPNKIGTIGICALDAKARSKPSRNILNRLVGKESEFDVVIFGDKVILDENVENWPVCDFLISFFSDGFPLEKAIAYVKLRRPFCVNDLPMQTVLWDRRMCLMILDRLGVPTPPRLEINRDGGPVALSTDIAQRMKQLTGVELIGSEDGRGGGQPPPKDVHMEDDNDTLVVNGKKLRKPFVEKPTSGEDHNINIYYPKSQGGGGRRLFRKINNKSSEKDDNLIVPRCITQSDESYIYEQFLKVENAEDVKAYTVGPDFCHAETRKSPVVDGVVKRNPNGKEIRYVTQLSKEEQIMASKIAAGFGQRICGFDLLRVQDPGDLQSYVIDVNGWSFVKDNNDYYDKCAKILKEMFIRERSKWDGLMTPAEAEEPEPEPSSIRSMPPPTSAPDKNAGFTRKYGPDSHRTALKSVFRSRSISQLRESVGQAAQHIKHPQSGRHASGESSPLSSTPPDYDRTPTRPRAPSVPPPKNELPPPAINPQFDGVQSEDVGRPASTDVASLAHSEAPSMLPPPAPKSQWKLKGMVAVIRHADRTPKQKFKFTFHSKPFVDLLKGHQEEVLLVGEAALNSVQQAVRQAMVEGVEDTNKLRTLQNALAKKGAWPGTKVQIKPMFKKRKDKDGGKQNDKIPKVAVTKPEEKIPEGNRAAPKAKDDELSAREQQRSDSLGDVTLSRAAAADQNLVLDKLQLVMKWGGEPTHSARYQATDLGENMRNDLLLMNRQVLDDVSVFTSSERRVTTSAQIFATAFLDEQELSVDQIRVRKDLLDDSNAAKDEMDRVKKKLKGLLREGHQAPEQFAWPKDGTPEPYLVVRRVVELMKSHRRVMRHNFSKLQNSNAVSSLEKLHKSPSTTDPAALANGVPGSSQTPSPESQASIIQPRWCTGEDAELFKERWEKLFNEFVDAEKVDPSKISELYDTMKFDALHNRPFLEWVFTPSSAILSRDDGAELGSRLKPTESTNAREEFAQTHDGHASSLSDARINMISSIAGPNGEMESLNLPPPKRSDTSSTTASGKDANSKEGKDKDRHSFSQRMGFRRKSADLMGVARSTAPRADMSQSYFNLYKGTVPAMQSKVKNDVRLEKLNELYSLSKILFDFIGPQEYGITDTEKLEIGLLTSLPLLKEIVSDIEEVQASDTAKSFIYFTKESHIYTLLNCILEGGVPTKIARNAIPELDYLSQICFELYESENALADIDPADPQTIFNYSIRITISPGCHTFDPLDVQLDSKHCIGFAQRRSLTNHGDWKEVLATLRAKFHTVKLPKSFTAVNLSERFPWDFVAGDQLLQQQEVDEEKEVERLKKEADEASGIAVAH